MLFVVTFCLYVMSAPANSVKGYEEKFCVLPPFPKHGTYTLQEPADLKIFAPGDRLPAYVLDIACDDGYFLSYNETQTCLGGLTSDDEPPECLPICNSTKIPGVLSCGVAVSGVEAKCIALQNIVAVTSKHAAGDDLECGIPETPTVQVISGGRIATAHEVPWHAGIFTKTTKPYMQICGGSIVSAKIVISAAHCFWGEVEKQRPSRNYAVAAGKLYRPWNDSNDGYAQKSDVSEIKIPPRFQGSVTSLQDDIALVVLTSPFELTSKVKPVCLDFDLTFEGNQLKPGALGKVSGWGLTSEDGKASPILKVVEMPLVDIQECITNVDPTFTRHVTSDKICAGYKNGTSVCKGDSGGGLSFPEVTNGEQRYFLRGIVSAAPSSDHLCNTVAWATFTRVLSHQTLIRELVPVS